MYIWVSHFDLSRSRNDQFFLNKDELKLSIIRKKILFRRMKDLFRKTVCLAKIFFFKIHCEAIQCLIMFAEEYKKLSILLYCFNEKLVFFQWMEYLFRVFICISTKYSILICNSSVHILTGSCIKFKSIKTKNSLPEKNKIFSIKTIHAKFWKNINLKFSNLNTWF